jgi:hypothetical protein
MFCLLLLPCHPPEKEPTSIDQVDEKKQQIYAVSGDLKLLSGGQAENVSVLLTVFFLKI